MSGTRRDFNNIETRAVINFFPLQGKAPKEVHAIPTETLDCFLPGRAKDLSAPHVDICVEHKTFKHCVQKGLVSLLCTPTPTATVLRRREFTLL